MQKYEFNNWVEFVKGGFPNFNPAKSELMLDAWRSVLNNVSLERAKTAVKYYTTEISSKYEPQPKDIKSILKDNAPIEVKSESNDNLTQGYAEKRFHDDIVLGVCRHNLYIYQQVYKTHNRINQELLEEACLKRTGKVAEFPSDEELKEKGINPKEKMPVEDIYRLLEIFKQKGCRL